MPRTAKKHRKVNPDAEKPGEHFAVKDIIRALQQSDGVLIEAAHLLGCSRKTIYRYIKLYPSVRQAYNEANETMLDFCERRLYRHIQDGNVTCLLFYMETKGKHRGYTKKWENLDIDYDKLNPEQLLRIEKGESPVDVILSAYVHGI
jgi:hypothetical protein